MQFYCPVHKLLRIIFYSVILIHTFSSVQCCFTKIRAEVKDQSEGGSTGKFSCQHHMLCARTESEKIITAWSVDLSKCCSGAHDHLRLITTMLYFPSYVVMSESNFISNSTATPF